MDMYEQYLQYLIQVEDFLNLFIFWFNKNKKYD